MKSILPITIAVLLSTGCVGQKRYKGLESELQASRLALAEALGDEEAASQRARNLSGEVAGAR